MSPALPRANLFSDTIQRNRQLPPSPRTDSTSSLPLLLRSALPPLLPLTHRAARIYAISTTRPTPAPPLCVLPPPPSTVHHSTTQQTRPLCFRAPRASPPASGNSLDSPEGKDAAPSPKAALLPSCGLRRPSTSASNHKPPSSYCSKRRSRRSTCVAFSCS